LTCFSSEEMIATSLLIGSTLITCSVDKPDRVSADFPSKTAYLELKNSLHFVASSINLLFLLSLSQLCRSK